MSTKFQPTFARRAFPCLDEPRFKSTFKVKLIHQADFTALSNMPPEVSDNALFFGSTVSDCPQCYDNSVCLSAALVVLIHSTVQLMFKKTFISSISTLWKGRTGST